MWDHIFDKEEECYICILRFMILVIVLKVVFNICLSQMIIEVIVHVIH